MAGTPVASATDMASGCSKRRGFPQTINPAAASEFDSKEIATIAASKRSSCFNRSSTDAQQ
jgi:hypothetical protein